jgi:PAS domain S-box-containing protein
VSDKVGYLLLEAFVVFAVVLGVHALRRRTTLVYSYAVLAFMRLGSWIATHHSMVPIGDLQLNVGSNIFFSATLLSVFLLYVADGRFAGRAALVVVVGSGLLYALMATIMHAQFPDFPEAMFPASGLRASLASIAASLLDLVLLGLVWETGQRRFRGAPLLLHVFVTLAVVFVADGLVYVPVAHQYGKLQAELGGIVFTRALVAALLAPVVAGYLSHEVRRYGLRLEPRPILSILLSEDAERELVTARHQLRIGTEALWESEERYRRMVEDIPVMVFRFSSDGRLTYANGALCRYYDRDIKEILGIPVLTPVDPAEREQLWSTVMALSPDSPTVDLIAHATPSRGPLQGQRRTHRWVIRGIFSPRGGERLAFQGVGRDITREVELEARAVDSQRMEAIGQLAGGIAHDFNNLIFVIWSCVEAASAQLAHASEGARGAAVDLLDIRKAADRASVLTRQLQAVSRQQPLQITAIDLSELLENVRPLLKRLLPASVGLEIHCAPAIPNVLVDPTQLERVIINLVCNARDAMPGGGVVGISTDAESLSDGEGPRPGRYAVISVTDTGTGMDAATARRVFEPFFTTKGQGKGSGLGLSTAYGIVEQAGGHIRVESAPGAGTTFFVYLPLTEAAATAPFRRSTSPGRSLGPILYCENEDSVRAQVIELLENAGYRVVCVRDAAEAMAFLGGPTASAPPCLLLLDLVAGELTGPELAAAVRKRHPRLPVIFFSGSADNGTHDPAGRFWYVNKRHGLSTLLTVTAEATAPAQGAGLELR